MCGEIDCTGPNGINLLGLFGSSAAPELLPRKLRALTDYSIILTAQITACRKCCTPWACSATAHRSNTISASGGKSPRIIVGSCNFGECALFSFVLCCGSRSSVAAVSVCLQLHARVGCGEVVCAQLHCCRARPGRLWRLLCSGFALEARAHKRTHEECTGIFTVSCSVRGVTFPMWRY